MLFRSDVYNYGNMARSFTFIDDIVDGVLAVHAKAPSNKPAIKLLNIGNAESVKLTDFIECLETCLNKKAICNYLPLQPGDVPETCADVAQLKQDYGYEPKVSVDVGVAKFVQWYREFYNL